MATTKKATKQSVSWIAPEFDYVEKSKDWYWIVWIIFLAVAGAALIVGNYSFAALVALSAFVFSLLASKKPADIPISLEKNKVVVGNKLYKVSDIKSYNFMPEEQRLLLQHTKPFIPIITLPLGPVAPEGAIRNYLSESKWEEDETISQPLLELVLERLGF